MERWQNKVAVVTGASSGIGAAVAEDLVKAGMVVVALARREQRLLENQAKLSKDLQSRYHPHKCDVSKEDEVKETFQWIEKKFDGTDVLINNAGVGYLDAKLTAPDNSKIIRETVETNVMAVVYCVREAFNSMKKRNFAGHVVIVNSIVGHGIPNIPELSFNIYPPTKYAVTAMTEIYRQEFNTAGTKVKVTSISPGTVETEIIKDRTKYREAGHPSLESEDIADAIRYIISTPPHVQIHELIIKPVGERF